MILVDVVYLDSEGIHKVSDNKVLTELGVCHVGEPLPKKVFAEMLSPEFGGLWNKYFDRNFMIPVGKMLNTL